MPDSKKQFDQWGPIDGRPLYSSFWFVFAMQQMKDRWGIYWPILEGVFVDDKMTFYWSSGQIKQIGEKAIRTYLLTSKKLKSLKKEYRKSIASLKSIARRIDRLVPDMDFRKVSSLASEWFYALNNFWLIAAVPEISNYAISSYFDKLLKPHVKNPETRKEAMRILLAPEYLSFHQKSELELLRTYSRSKLLELHAKLAKYAANWYWVENSYYGSKRLDDVYFFKQLRGLSRGQAREKVEKIENYPKRVKAEKKKIARACRLPDNLVRIASQLAYSIWWQDDRKAVVWWVNSIIDKLSKLAGKEFRLGHNEIMHYLYDEWLRIFTEKRIIPRQVLQKRRKKFALIINLKGYRIYPGKKADVILKKYADPENHQDKIAKGLTVSHGKLVVGRVRLVPSTRDISNFRRGEILIAPMTSPDYVPVMRKAKAVVTDVGGLMSHAAVVSRELGIPCVVGTRIATKIFKDGDMVEVDANAGIVRKLG